jgi:type IV pilus biogenesis protein CpaD/CtpE
MRPNLHALAALAGLLAACSSSDKPAPPVAKSSASPVRITQFYTTTPKLARGEKGLICYGSENGKTVWLSPPRQELSAALARCVDIQPEATTTYTLTAEGVSGPPATQQLTVTVGAAKARIVDVTVSSLAVKHGDPVSVCFHARNAVSVEIAPLHFHPKNPAEGCTLDHPAKTTTYVISITGADGDEDHERVTVTVQ